MFSSARDSHWSDVHPQLSRREVLEDAFHADARHPARRLLVEVSMALAPVLVLALSVGVLFLVH